MYITQKYNKVATFKECMCCLRNIAMCDYQEGVTTGQTDAGQSDPYVPLCFAGDTKTDHTISDHHIVFAFHANNGYNPSHFEVKGHIYRYQPYLQQYITNGLLHFYILLKYTCIEANLSFQLKHLSIPRSIS